MNPQSGNNHSRNEEAEQSAVGTIVNEVRTYLTGEAIYSGLLPDPLDADFDLIRAGALDSIGVFNLVAFLEGKYRIKVEPQDLTESHFKSLTTVARFVLSRRV